LRLAEGRVWQEYQPRAAIHPVDVGLRKVVNDLFTPEAVQHSAGLSSEELRLLGQQGWTGPLFASFFRRGRLGTAQQEEGGRQFPTEKSLADATPE
jgi:hypothetical protein